MHKAILAVLLCLVCASAAAAQSTTPRWELMGGFTEYVAGGEFSPYLPNGSTGPQPGQLPTQGFQIGLSRPIKSYFRITGEINEVFGKEALAVEHLPPGGQYKTGNQFLFMTGPEATVRTLKRVDLFAHFLIGLAHAVDNQTPAVPNNTYTSWNFGVGFGVDLKTGHRFAIRIVEADYITSHFPKQDFDAEDNWRYSTGVVYRFGH